MPWGERRSNWKKQDNDARTPGDIDYGRVIHSASFRRLQGKTQILNLGDSDFYRNRLTHSLEVAQIAAGLCAQIRQDFPEHGSVTCLPDRSMMQAISCTHDLGHPPFGHGGEVALNYCMRNDGGFEGNGQTLRILSKLEKFSETHGADLSREALLGVLKYPVSYGNLANKKNVPRMVDETSGTPILDRKASKPPKCYMDSEEDVVDWIVGCLSDNDRTLFQSYENVVEGHHKAKYKSFSCSIMDIADDISFGVHDMEDALSLSLVNEGDFRNHVKEGDCDGLIDYLKSKYPTEFKSSAYDALVGKIFSGGSGRKHQINRILNYIITNIMVSDVEGFDELRLRYRASLSDPVSKFVGSVKNFIQEVVVFSPGVQHLEFKGQMMVISVFEVMKSDPKSFLPRDIFQKYKQTEDPMRTICDYVAGMTDSYLLKTYERLFSPRIGSVFDKL